LIGNNGIGVLLMKLDKTTHFQSETDLFKKTAVKWKSIANRDNGTRFAIEEDKETFGLEIEIQRKYDGKSVTNYTINNKLSTQMIWSMYKKTIIICFGMAEGGVYNFNGKSFDKIF
jgi:hypothetical protein